MSLIVQTIIAHQISSSADNGDRIRIPLVPGFKVANIFTSGSKYSCVFLHLGGTTPSIPIMVSRLRIHGGTLKTVKRTGVMLLLGHLEW